MDPPRVALRSRGGGLDGGAGGAVLPPPVGVNGHHPEAEPPVWGQREGGRPRLPPRNRQPLREAPRAEDALLLLHHELLYGAVMVVPRGPAEAHAVFVHLHHLEVPDGAGAAHDSELRFGLRGVERGGGAALNGPLVPIVHVGHRQRLRRHRIPGVVGQRLPPPQPSQLPGGHGGVKGRPAVKGHRLPFFGGGASGGGRNSGGGSDLQERREAAVAVGVLGHAGVDPPVPPPHRTQPKAPIGEHEGSVVLQSRLQSGGQPLDVWRGGPEGSAVQKHCLVFHHFVALLIRRQHSDRQLHDVQEGVGQ